MHVTQPQARRALERLRIPWDERVRDPRRDINVKHGQRGLLGALVGAFACGRSCLRRAEDFASDLSPAAKRRLGLRTAPTDTTFYRLLEKQSPEGLRESVRAQVNDLLRRQVVSNDLLATGVVAFDGKVIWSSTSVGIEGAKQSIDERSGTITNSMMALRAVLVSSGVRPCLDQVHIGEKAGEAPAFRALFPDVVEHFGAHFEVVTADAGIGCRENASVVLGAKKHYLFSLKGNQPRLEAAAVERFEREPGAVLARSEEPRDGAWLTRELRAVSVVGCDEVVFPGAVQFWQVTQRLAIGDHVIQEERRHFITDLVAKDFGPERGLRLVRLHWGIENGANWTMDVALREDDFAPCQQGRHAIEVVSWLRVLGYNLLAAARGLAPRKDRLLQSWQRTMELLRDTLCRNEAWLPVHIA